MVSKLLKMQLLEYDDEAAFSPDTKAVDEKKMTDGRPAWMRTLHNSIQNWLKFVPKVQFVI